MEENSESMTSLTLKGDRNKGGGLSVHNGSDSQRRGSGNVVSLESYSQLMPNRNKNFIIYFVIPLGKETTSCFNDQMNNALKVCDEHYFVFKVIKGEHLLEGKVVPHPRNLFVLQDFEGQVYDFLKGFLTTEENSVIIIGPQVIRYVFHSKEPNVKLRNFGHAVFSLALSNLSITLSGFDEKQRKELGDQIRMMGGGLTGGLTSITSYVVTSKSCTEKSLLASQRKIPLMQSSWVTKLWNESQTKIIDSKDPQLTSFEAPLFHQITFCLSQVSISTKKTLKAIIEKNGGICKAELVRGATDILIIPVLGSEKSNFALKWKLICVTPNWIESCDDSRRLLPVKDFIPHHPTIMSSTFTNSVGSNKFPDTSGISEIPRANKSNMNVTVAESLEVANIDADLEMLKLAVQNGSFLDGYKIYVCKSTKGEEIKKLLGGSGATRFDKISEGVSHIIVIGEKLSKAELERIAKLESTPHVVRLTWLLESAAKGETLPEEDYEFKLDGSGGNCTKESNINDHSIVSVLDLNDSQLSNAQGPPISSGSIIPASESINKTMQEYQGEPEPIQMEVEEVPAAPGSTRNLPSPPEVNSSLRSSKNSRKSSKTLVREPPRTSAPSNKLNESNSSMDSNAPLNSPDISGLNKSESDHFKKVLSWAASTPPPNWKAKSKWAIKMPKMPTPDHIVSARFWDAFEEAYARDEALAAAKAANGGVTPPPSEFPGAPEQGPSAASNVKWRNLNEELEECEKEVVEVRKEAIEDPPSKKKKANNEEKAEEAEKQRKEAEKLARDEERAEKRRRNAEKLEKQRKESERAAKEAKEAERKRKEEEKAAREAKQIEKERKEAELQAKEAEKQRKDEERRELERREAEKAEKAEKEAEKQRKEAEKLRKDEERRERERKEAEKAEKEAKEAEKRAKEAERIEKERLEAAELAARSSSRTSKASSKSSAPSLASIPSTGSKGTGETGPTPVGKRTRSRAPSANEGDGSLEERERKKLKERAPEEPQGSSRKARSVINAPVTSGDGITRRGGVSLDEGGSKSNKSVPETGGSTTGSSKNKTTGSRNESGDGAAENIIKDFHIMMSGTFENYDKPILIEMLSKLGGSVSKLSTFDPESTGMVAGSLSRSEKILCCIASGKFIVKAKFIQDSAKANKFIDPTPYFFTEEDCVREAEKNLARAAISSYEKKRRDPGSCPFARMKMYLLEDNQQKRSAYSRLIRAGGGEVVTEPQEATIVISIKAEAGSQLAKSIGATYKNPIFLNECILQYADSI